VCVWRGTEVGNLAVLVRLVMEMILSSDVCVGLITTTRRILDREQQDEHVLEVGNAVCRVACSL